MEEKKNLPQPDSGLSEEEQLDQLLEQFLADPDDTIPELPSLEVSAQEAPAEDPPVEEPVQAQSKEAPQEASEAAAPEIPAQSEENLWSDTPLEAPVENQEIGPDEQAVAAAGLTHPDDMEFIRILEETLQAEWEAEEAGETTDEDPYPLTQEELQAISQEIAEEFPEEASAEPDEESSALYADEEVLEEEEEEGPPRKRRPKNNTRYGFWGIPHLLSTLIWLMLIVFIGAGLGRMVWLCAADVLALGREDKIVTITITDSDIANMEQLADKLKETGLIKYPGLFLLYADLSDAQSDINTGTFKLNTLYDYHALVDHMAGNASRVTVNVTVPEGYTCAQIFKLLEEKGVCSAQELQEAAQNYDLSKFWFLEGIDQSSPNCLEGYLFPDTYKFYLDHDADGVLYKFLDNFDDRFTDVMKEKLDTLNLTLADMMRENGLPEDYIESHKMTIREIVIIASMIEKETANNAESYTVSSVIYNRLTNPAEHPHLNIDATLVYYTGRSKLTAEDLLEDHPYNTYVREGLIPGPISNPGRASLDAALDPEETNYHYYALDPSTGAHHFSKTYSEHKKFLDSLKKSED